MNIRSSIELALWHCQFSSFFFFSFCFYLNFYVMVDVFGDSEVKQHQRELAAAKTKFQKRVEKILNWRPNPNTGEDEFYIKWQKRS